ncbi:MAG: hypothetical protein FWG43_01045 [Clostridiales bacterium]|nr:hypothetical protein [Clostridiales bacterium]
MAEERIDQIPGIQETDPKKTILNVIKNQGEPNPVEYNDSAERNFFEKEFDQRYAIIRDISGVWKKREEIKNAQRVTLFIFFICALAVQFFVLICLIVLNATVFFKAPISDIIFISVLAAIIIETLGVIYIMTKGLYGEETDKIIDFYQSWIGGDLWVSDAKAKTSDK